LSFMPAQMTNAPRRETHGIGKSGDPPSDAGVRDAYRECAALARRHYENFPVASLLLPRALRLHVAVVYAFARIADDYADEGDLPPDERLRLLDEWDRRLEDCFMGRAEHPVFIALRETARQTGVSKQPFSDLLTAFRMDVTKMRYDTFDDLLVYCRHSADPVGRLVLGIFGDAEESKCVLSDSICTGLQLANHWQDVAGDLARGRIYIPLEDFDRFGYTTADLERRLVDERFRALMKMQVDRSARFLEKGRPLVHEAAKDLRFELDLTVAGGLAVLEKIRRQGYDVLSRRPHLSAGDKMMLLLRAASGKNR